MKILENSLFLGLNSMALKRLLRWAVLESDRFKYFTLRRNFCCSFRLHGSHLEMITLKPKTVYMRKDGDNLHFDVSIFVDYPPLKLSKTLHVRRPLESSLMLFLQRINLKIYAQMEKIKEKKKRKDKLDNTEYPAVNALLYLDDNQLSDETVCSEIFELRGKLIFRILDDSYSVQCNSPWINALGLPKVLKSNMVIHPLKFSSVNCDVDKSSFTWFKSEISGYTKTNVCHIQDWVKLGQGFFYNVTENEVGHYLKLECVPKNDTESGPTFTELTLTTVERGECNYYYLNTHKLTKESAGENKVRIVTYNVLAGMYTSTKEAKTMFDYCPKFAIDKSQRYSATSIEIAGYNADLVCLQEVELLNYQGYLMPSLQNLGYMGLNCLKSQDREGTACIFKKDKFVALGSKNCVFSHEITNNLALTDILNYVKQKEEFYQKYISLPHCIQFVALRSLEKKNEVLIVGIVHLYSSPEADLTRLLQAISSFCLFQGFIENLGPLLKDLNKTLILCGDFNSTPDSLLHELVMNGSISSDHSIWGSEGMEGCKGLSFSLPVKMESACGTPEFTNYTRVFKGCLDYIYYQIDRLEVDKMYPLASEDVLSENVGLPSASFPSDHLPLIVDMKWKY